MTEPVSALDATFLELEEADESAHMHIGAIMVFEPTRHGAPELDAVRRMLSERLDALPRYSMRLSEPRTGGLHWPTWEADPRFDIGDHVRHAALPAPGGADELAEWAADYWSTRLDRNRPLWEAVLLEGLERGRWALATKTHHALVDGVGSVDVGHLLLDASRRPRRQERPSATRREGGEGGHHSALLALPAALLHGAQRAVDAVRPGSVVRALEQSRALVGLILREEVVAAPRTSLNCPIGTRRRYAVVETSLDDLKAVKKTLGGTVNDVVLAVSAGALRALLLARGEEPPSEGLRAMVPVNVRTAAEHLEVGNKISSLFAHLPVAEPDALRRYRLTLGEAEALKAGSQAVGGSTLVALTSLAPPVAHSLLARSLFASRLFNVTITNVPGPQRPLYAFGARLEQVYPLVPLAADHAVGIAVVSYAGRVFFGINADDRAVADLEVLREGIRSSIEELGAHASTPTAAVSGKGTRARNRSAAAGR